MSHVSYILTGKQRWNLDMMPFICHCLCYGSYLPSRRSIYKLRIRQSRRVFMLRTSIKSAHLFILSEDAMEAERLGATYVTAGHIFTTDCKKGLPPRGLDFLKNVCDAVTIPVYGIGGIKFDPQQWNSLKKQGACGGCIMSGMMQL